MRCVSREGVDLCDAVSELSSPPDHNSDVQDVIMEAAAINNVTSSTYDTRRASTTLKTAHAVPSSTSSLTVTLKEGDPFSKFKNTSSQFESNMSQKDTGRAVSNIVRSVTSCRLEHGEEKALPVSAVSVTVNRSTGDKLKVTSIPTAAAAVTINRYNDEKHPSAFNSNSSLTVSQASSDKAALASGAASVLPVGQPASEKQPSSRVSASVVGGGQSSSSSGGKQQCSPGSCSASLLTVTQSHQDIPQKASSASSSASSVYVSESESESSHASTVRNPFSSGSSLSGGMAVDDVTSASVSRVTENLPRTEDGRKNLFMSQEVGNTKDKIVVQCTRVCDDGTKGNDDQQRVVRAEEKDKPANSATSGESSSSRDSSAGSKPTFQQGSPRSRASTPDSPRFSQNPQAFFQLYEAVADNSDSSGSRRGSESSRPTPELPERYRHVLRRNGSYASIGSCGGGGGGGGGVVGVGNAGGSSMCLQENDDEDLSSREKDLGSALAWIRHEMIQMKEQDKVLLKRFIDLRASILQLRCMYDVLGSTSDLSSMDGSSLSLNEVRKAPRVRHLVRTESEAMMSGGIFKATSSLSLPCSPQLSRLRWQSDDLI